ncbi:MAG: adenylosuccinate lyase [Oscillospiraceae bacterium]|jgi:adenylosuccinate lyase|nr:adenylosuccinate lyase [Oscillospiraceae bacterium]
MSDRYENPLCRRYASERMQRLFSDDNKFSTWRKLWVALAESQMELGLGVTAEQIAQMKARVTDIDYGAAARYERETRHDVMAHIRAYAEQCPLAGPIIHLGATSCYVTDNTDIIIQKTALSYIREKLTATIGALAAFAERHKALPCLAYTHFQPAQPTTAGKRATLWMQDLLLDLEHLDFSASRLKLLGCKGATGTAAGFLSLFGGNHEKVVSLERKICEKMGFPEVFPVTGQTYPRKLDFFTLSALSGIAQSAYKFSSDVRLLQHLQEADEPREPSQVGSSAMAYKRNPMRSERMASLSRFIIVSAQNTALTASEQWFERTLDDSANRRIVLPEAFLAADAVLSLYINVIGGLTPYPGVMRKHLREELPFLAAENILMQGVKKGGDRQELHERIRRHSMDAAENIKLRGKDNDLLERIASDRAFGLDADELADILRAEDFTGRAKEQTEEFLASLGNALGAFGQMRSEDINITV